MHKVVTFIFCFVLVIALSLCCVKIQYGKENLACPIVTILLYYRIFKLLEQQC